MDSMDPERSTVLVVDDDRELADLFAHWLRPDYEVIVAYGGEEALDVVNDTIDVVLLDRRMPDVHGDEVLVAIRDRGYDCRVAMVTAVDPGIDVLDLGFDDYLTKPIDRERLVAAVRRLERYEAYTSLHAELTTKLVRRNVIRQETPRHVLAESDAFATLEADIERLREQVATRKEPRRNQQPARRSDSRGSIVLPSP